MCFKRLFLLIIRLYKSFKSEAAKRPPSRGTKGLKSGGITGRTDKTIHSGLLPESLNSFIILIRRISFVLSASLCVSFNCASSAGISLLKSKLASKAWIAGAPISALSLEPYFLRASRTCSSDKISPFLKSVLPVTESTASSRTT